MSWRKTTIGDLGRVVTGRTPPRARPDYFGDEHPFVTPSDLDFMHYYCTSSAEGISELGFEKHQNQMVSRDAAMCVCIGNTIGKCAIAREPCLTNQQINSVIANANNDPKFLYYLLCNLRERIRAVGLAGGSAQPIINKSKFSALEVQVPDLGTQQVIAEVLSAYDDLIENNRQRIALLEEAARLLYRKWFVHLRFPGHEHFKIIDGLPERWMTQTVGDLAKIKGGKQLGRTLIREFGPVPVYGGNGVQGYTDNKNYNGFVIVFGRVGANCGSVHWSYDGAWINNNASGLVPHTHPELLLHHMLNCNFSSYRKGAAQPFIPNGVLSTIRFRTPHKSLASLFCEFTRTMRLQQVTLTQQNQKLRQARNLLLPRLMNREILV